MRQPVLVTLAVLIAWYFSFLIIFIIPLDVSNTIYSNCTISNLSDDKNLTSTSTSTSTSTTSTTTSLSTTTTTLTLSTTTSLPANTTPSSDESSHASSVLSRRARATAECEEPASYIPSQHIFNLWRVVYWSSQLLTWLLLPLMQSFTQAGEFTFVGKLKSSLWDNAIFYSSYLFIAIILVIYISLQPGLHLDWQKLKAIAAAASNTWGLFLLVFMMGYGLVEVPRILWRSSQRGYSLNQAYFKISKLFGERNDAEGNLEEVLVSVAEARRKLDTGDGEHLTQFVDIIMAKVPGELMDRVKRREARTEAAEVTEAGLAKLHKQVMVAMTAHFRTEAQWQHMVDTVLWLEDNHKNSSSSEKIFRRQSSTEPGPGLYLSPHIEWQVRCVIVPHLLKMAAIMAGMMSVMLTWSEVTFSFSSPTLSLYAIFIQLAASHDDYRWIEVISFLTITYMASCTFFTVFRVRVLNYYYLASNHQSDSYTLLFSGALLSRITPPLCLNFLSLIHMDSHVFPGYDIETSYTKIMGHMDVVSIVQDGFNIYFPILLLVLTLATYFSLGSRLLSFLGFQQFLEQEEMTGEFVEEGRELIKREKRRRERLEQSQRTRREWTSKSELPDTEASTRQRSAPLVAGGGNSVRYTSEVTTEGSLVDIGLDDSNNSGRKEPPRNLFDDL